MSLSNEQKKHYRAIGHGLKPIVTVAGNGLSDNVIAEITRALKDHELIKVKIALPERDDRKTATDYITEQTGSTLVQSIGKVVLLFKRADKSNARLSNLRR